MSELFTKQTHRRILRCLAKRGVRYADREDVAQEVWMVVFRRIDTVRDRSRLPAWINGVCRNITRDANRKAGYRQRYLELSDDPTAVRRTQVEPSLPMEASLDLRRTLDDLEGVEHTILERSMDGKSVREIAELMGRTEGYVYRHRRKMRSTLEHAVNGAPCRSKVGEEASSTLTAPATCSLQ